MRQIKFRVWDSKNKVFFYLDSNDVIISNANRHLNGKILLELKLRFFNQILVDVAKVPYGDEVRTSQQFTGLKDKNGREIYEGDIINFYVRGATHGREREFYQNQEVFYSEKNACFMFGKNYTKTGDHWSHCMLDEIEEKTLEVVGNVFEDK